MTRTPAYAKMGDRVFCLLNVSGHRAYFALDSVTTIEPRSGNRCVVWVGGHAFEFAGSVDEVFGSMAEQSRRESGVSD